MNFHSWSLPLIISRRKAKPTSRWCSYWSTREWVRDSSIVIILQDCRTHNQEQLSTQALSRRTPTISSWLVLFQDRVWCHQRIIPFCMILSASSKRRSNYWLTSCAILITMLQAPSKFQRLSNTHTDLQTWSETEQRQEEQKRFQSHTSITKTTWELCISFERI